MPKPDPREFREDVIHVVRLLEQDYEVLLRAAAYLTQAEQAPASRPT